MRVLPQKLREKIQKANQTIYENADPKMDVLLRRARTGLTGSDLFYMQTIREGTDLQDLAIDLQRTNVNAPPSRAYNIYIKDGICKVATKNMPSKVKEEWQDVLTIGEATDCEIAFDGRWYRDDEYRWQLVTQGNPWLFYVRDGDLYARHWDKEPVLLASGVSKISAIRGWKNTYHWNHDQGIIVAYIKSGTIYYRNYCQQPPDQPAIWEIERTIDLPTPAQNIALFRTNDYRVGFICESNGQMHWTITTRNWANMAIEPHSITASPVSLELEYIAIEYPVGKAPAEYINAVPSIELDYGYVLTDNHFVEVYNQPIDADWGKELIIRVEHKFYTTNSGDFELVDGINRIYYPNAIEQIGNRTYKLTFLDFNNAGISPNATLRFLGLYSTNAIDLLFEPFEMVFQPQNLVPLDIPVPEVEVVWNE